MGDDVIGVYPDCAEPLAVFSELATQWRIGMSGPTGLDYSVLVDVFRIKQIPKSRWQDLFADIRVMEREALSVIHKKD
jgi:hypothetical protein